jgi:hypothetical protein
LVGALFHDFVPRSRLCPGHVAASAPASARRCQAERTLTDRTTLAVRLWRMRSPALADSAESTLFVTLRLPSVDLLLTDIRPIGRGDERRPALHFRVAHERFGVILSNRVRLRCELSDRIGPGESIHAKACHTGTSLAVSPRTPGFEAYTNNAFGSCLKLV